MPPYALRAEQRITTRFRSDNTSTSKPSNPEQTSPPQQPGPSFPGYTVDPLDAPLQFHTNPQPLATIPPPQTPPTTQEEQTLAKARVIFGSRLAGPAERQREKDKLSVEVAGVLVPPRPEEPDNCCMSGCVNCVWDVYQEEVEEWGAKTKESKARMAEWEKKRNGKESGLNVSGEGEDLFEGIPVGIREFMRTEKKLKERKRGLEMGRATG